MASLSFPVTGLQPVMRDQPGSAPPEAGGVRAVNPNQQDAPQGDTVTISASFPPAQAAQQPANVSIQEFTFLFTQTDVQASQTATPTAATGAPPAPQVNVQAAAATGAPALASPADPGTAAAIATTSQAGATSDPQKELAQLDQTLQQLGIDPQTISLFNRMGLLLYANDPAALENLVQTMKALDQQLNQLGGGTNGTTQPQNAAQALLSATNQAQSKAQQGTARVTPDPLTPIRGTTPSQGQAPATSPAQLEGRNQNPAGNGAGTAVFAAQLSFSEVQATIQEQSAAAQGSSSNQSTGNGASGAASAQTNNLLVNFQEFQLTFQAIEVQTQPQQTAGANASTAQTPAQGLNVKF